MGVHDKARQGFHYDGDIFIGVEMVMQMVVCLLSDREDVVVKVEVTEVSSLVSESIVCGGGVESSLASERGEMEDSFSESKTQTALECEGALLI